MTTIEECFNELDNLRGYMHFKIPLLSAIHLGYHKPKHIGEIITTTIWESQILNFKEWKEIRPTKSFHQVTI